MKRVSHRKLRRAQSSPLVVRSRRPRPLGVSLSRFASAVAMVGALLGGVGAANAGTFYWDPDLTSAGNAISGANLGGLSSTWDTAANQWWDGVSTNTSWPNSNVDHAIFTGPVTLVPSTVTLSPGITANKLSFLRSGYTLTGGGLTMAGATPTVHVNFAESATLGSLVAGSDGLTKVGGGTLRLTNIANSYTGATTISGGILSISNATALGADPSAIIVSGSGTRGFGGGALMLEGGYTSGVSLSRAVSLQGLGPIGANAVALISIGNNTVTGSLSNAGGTVNTAVSSAAGRLTFSDVAITGTSTSTLTFGSGNGGGVGSYAITGALTGVGVLGKTGSGVLHLTPSSATGFSGIVQITAGSVRINDNAVLGTSAATNAIDLNGGTLEIRADTLNFGARRVNMNNAGGGTDLFLDRAVGGTGLNQTATFANIDYDVAETFVINSRNGYGVTFTAATAIGATTDNSAFNNNGNGLVTYGGTLWGLSDTSSRTLTFGGNGNTTLTGNVTATGAAHHLVKSGTGVLTINGTASTYTGNTTITGTISVGNLGAINKTAATTSILLNGGTLQYTGATADTLAKPFSLTGATANNAIVSSGAGALTITGNVGAGGVGAKTLFLGGTGTANNTFSSLLLDNNVGGATTGPTGLAKIGEGTWLLKEPSPGAYGAVGSVTIAAPGTTATSTITLSSGTTAGLVVGQVLAGTTATTPPQITSIIDATHFTVGVALTTATAPAGSYTVNAIPTTSTTTAGGTWSGPLTIASGTLKLSATNAASNIVQNSNVVAFNVDAFNANQTAGGTLEFVGVSGLATTETLGSLTPTAGAGTVKLTSGGGGAAANLIFSSPLGTIGKGSGVNFNTTGGGGGTVTLSGVADTTATTLPGNGHFYMNGSDFAVATGGTGLLGAPTYTAAGAIFTTAPAGVTGLTASKHNLVTGPITAQTAVSVTSLKLTTSNLTMAAAGTLLTVNTGAVANDGGILQTGGSASITQGVIQSGGAGTIVIRVNGETDVLTLGATIGGTSTGGFTKNGLGKLIITGTNTQTGTNTINEGIVQLQGASARLSAANAQLDIRQGGTLDLNGQSTGVAIGAFNGAGTVTNTNTAAATLIIGNATTGAGTFSGTIDDGPTGGVINLSVTGTTGTHVLSGLNTYSGVTTIGTGLNTTAKLVSVPILANYGTASGIGKGIQTVVSDANNAASLVFGGLATAGINYTGTNSISIDRLFTLNGGFAGAGATIANSSGNNSSLILNKTNPLTFGAGATVAQTLTLGGSSTGDNQINLQITDNGALPTSLVKSGASLWILGNALNNYTGTTTISGLGATAATAGYLQAVDGSTLPNASGLILGGTTTGGVFQSQGNFTRNLVVSTSAGSNTVSWAAGLTTGPSGFSASDSKLVVALGGLATPTALTWNVGGFMGTAGTTLLFGSGTALSEVEFRNAIDLNAANRTIQVDDNGNTAADFATITGVISNSTGTAGISKTGSGVLQLFGANTYNGSTAVPGGTIVVKSLGLSTDPFTPTSVGTNLGANTAAQAIVLGNGSNTGGSIQYVGAGETSDRMIRLNTQTGSNIIYADGTGPLVLTNLQNEMTAGNKTLFLRGANTQGNMITSSLADNIAGTNTFGVTADGGATWILSGNNSYTGTTTASAGALGAGSNNAFGTGTLLISNGSVFAYGADRTLTNPITSNGTTTTITAAFIGDYSLNLTGLYTNTITSASHVITNAIGNGKALTFGGNLIFNAITGARTLTFNGSGDTIVNGNITTSTTFGINLTYSGTGSLTLGGTASDRNTGILTVSSGTVKLGNDEVIAHGSATESGNVVISPAVGVTATFDLNGKTETINGLTANSAGTTIIDNTSASPGHLIVGSNNTAVDFASGVGAYTITDSGAGALSLTKTGSTAMTIPAGATLSYQGTTNVNGGALNIASPLNGTSGLSATGASTLALTGGLTVPGAITSIEVGGGSTLSLLDGVGTQLSNLTTLKLGNTGVGQVTLNLNIGDVTAGDGLNTDTLSLLTGGTLNLGNTIRFNMTDAGLNANTTYTLLNVPGGGLNAFGLANFLQGATPGGFTSFTWDVQDTFVKITTGTLITGASYWRGLTGTTWNGAANNWSTDKAGTTPAASIPGQGTDVIFQWEAPTNAAVTTTLEQNFKINSLTFEAAGAPANTPTSVTINPGAMLTNRLEIAPQLAADGIKITAGGPAAVTIAAPVKLGSNQTWSVADAASVLSLTAGLQGEKDVTKSGAGKVTLGAAADSTFNTGTTADFTITGGTLELLDAGALGSVANGNAANIAINAGAFYLNNATSGVVPGNLTLAGGTLSAGGNAQTYGVAAGTVTISADSTINMRDQNSAVTSASARSITLPGNISGTGKLTVDSVDTLSGGINPITGTLTLAGSNGSWSGGIDLKRGTITATNVNALGTGAITASGGRIIFNTAGGTTFNLAQNITVDAAGGVFELSADASGTPVSDLNANLTGVITLGSSTNANNALRVSQASDNFSLVNISNSIVLGNNASISYQGSSGRPLTISAVISETGGARNLAINDELGGWGVTSQAVRLTGANTFTGGISLTEGALEFTTVSNIGGAASSLGRGSAISVGAATLRFVGNTSQATDRPITQTGLSIYSANGTAGASITYNGAIAGGTNGFTLTGAAGSVGNIASGITTTGATDATVSGGTWNLTGATSVGDDLFVTGTSTILNLNSTGALVFTPGASTSATLVLRDGAVVNIGANDAIPGADFDALFIAQDAGGATTTLNLNNFNLTTTRMILGERAADRTGQIDGTGTLNVTGVDGIDLYKGTINANLASTGTGTFEKFGSGTVTLKGNNSGLTANGTISINEGTLVFDYTADTNSKIKSNQAVSMVGATLRINGSDTFAISQTLGSLTLGSGGSSEIDVNGGFERTAVLNLGAITRANGSQDGTMRFFLPVGPQNSTNGITTATLNTNGLLGTSGFATVNDGTGTWFATNGTNLAGGNIIALVSSPKNATSTWATADHITDETTGFTGALAGKSINSLRFNASAGSDLNLTTTGVLGIASGGILVTDSVTTATPSIANGTLSSGAAELIVTQDSSQTFEISADIRVTHAVTKTGTGTLLLSGNNTYSDETEIQEGTLQVSGGNAIGDSSIVTLGANRNSTLQLLANETIGRLAGGQRNTNSDYGTVAIGANTLTNNNSGNATFAGFFTGTGSIVLQQGTGNFGMSNVSSGFTGTVIVNSGLFQLTGIGQNNASSFTVNKGGNLLIDNNGTVRSTTRILDTTPITLNSADGSFSGVTAVRGLAIRTDQNADTSETIGDLNFNSGASYLTGEASGTTGRASIIANNFTRSNNATMDARGRAMGGTAGDRNQFRIGTTGNETTFVANLVGGGGAAASQSVSIVPWAIGETTTGSITDSNMGNSLVTYVTGAGLRALDFATEYDTFASAAANENARESITANLTGLAGKTVNSLVLHNANNTVGGTSVNVTGAGGALVVTSGAMLFTLNPLASASADNGIVLGGFDGGITVGATNEYVIHVVKPSSANASPTLTGGSTDGTTTITVASTAGLLAGMTIVGPGIPIGATVASVSTANTTTFTLSVPTAPGNVSGLTFTASAPPTLGATIASPLTSSADITKSGRGALILSANNTAGGGTHKTTINEGTLEIADLDNIGGNTGGLVFAGGTLRLGSALLDDITSRTITFLNGGATIDTNGLSPTFAGSIGSGAGGLTKTGAGNLTLNSAATYTGPTTITTGTLTVGANNALGNGGNVNVGAGATLALGTNNITAGVVTTSGASPIISGTGTISATRFAFNHTGNTTIDAVLAGTGGLLKTQTNVLTLTGNNTYTGSTEVQGGTLVFNSIGNVGSGASALGNPANAEDGIIRLGLTTAATVLSYNGSGHSSNRLVGLQGTTGTTTLDADGTGALVLSGVRGETPGAKTLTLQGSSLAAVNNGLGIIDDYAGVISVLKAETNTWELNGTNTYTGTTTVANGILRLNTNQTMAGALAFGAAATAGTLDMTTSNAQFSGMSVLTNSNTLTNTATIGVGKTLTINGPVTIGSNAAASTTRFTATGGGAFVNTNLGGTFQIGGATGATNANAVNADFSGLASFTVNLGAGGTFRQGDNNSSTPVNATNVKLAVNNTITAANVRIGDGSGAGSVHTLTLGSGTNVIHTDVFNVGSAGTTIRSSGAVVFDGADTTGNLTVRALDGVGAATINMVNTTGTTGTDIGSTVDLSGHTVDILASTLTMANRNTSSANTASATLSFDQGTLAITTLNMGNRAGTGVSTATAIVNLGDSAAPGTPSTTIGTLNMAVNTSSGGTVTADLNITGGDVGIGTGVGTAINMANTATAGRTATSTIDITGGNVTVNGNIIRSGGAGTQNATVTLAGGSLNMSGFGIGTGAAPVALVAQSGSLRGLGAINGAGALTKTTAGTLEIAGSNGYTGPTNVSAGTVNLSGSISATAGVQLDGTGTMLLSRASGEQINDNASVMLNGGTLAFNDPANQIETLGTLTLTANSIIDFGLGGGNDTLFFNPGGLAIAGHTAGATLTIQGWVGNTAGGTNGIDDRLLFSGSSSEFFAAFNQADITFSGFGSGFAAIDFAGGYEIVPVPEPSSTALIGAAGLLALVGYRERRRLSSALARKNRVG